MEDTKEVWHGEGFGFFCVYVLECLGRNMRKDEQNVLSCFSKTEYLHTQTQVPVFWQPVMWTQTFGFSPLQAVITCNTEAR